jgi:hypothetical protein
MANNKRLTAVSKATQFSSDNQPENRGRKHSVLKFIKDSGLSITDIKRLLGSLIWDYDSKELSALLKDKENPVPMGMALVLGALTEDLKNKNLTNFERLMDRAFGKSTQGMDIRTSGTLEIISMTSEKRKKRIEALLKETRNKAKKTKHESDKPNGK